METKIGKDRIKVSLRTFIENRHILLSALGIFAALTLFSQTLLNNLIGIFVSFMLLSCLTLLYLEYLQTFEKEEETTESL